MLGKVFTVLFVFVSNYPPEKGGKPLTLVESQLCAQSWMHPLASIVFPVFSDQMEQ
jgi:hypothetical protein